ncbi:hypothetical protein CEUSTIGMA_g9562.t1 [Chlamydomonas eustigma]|uniref:ABC1 atypical kinase-like domain-containing protein n=1 Tax=Chlamydomonas eustigma TaxID=1157962 RepID=A0A250XGC6_9CHLO|nr:hypothetical protein CEUSTIGMA_g9562.t1 [Chlamydomonas eustigma]|eukprot:GAX82134.1 hypothetical protein CEUSTIGMA_g9562.t1 [Chlamydomonas eustigma]
MNFLICKWQSYFALLQPQHDCMGSSAFSGSGTYGLLLSHSSWSIPHHSKAHALSNQAVASSFHDTALKLLHQSRSLVLSGAILTAAISIYEDMTALIRSTPSTMRLVIWSVQSGLQYKQLMSTHSEHNSEQYAEQLRILHTQLATSLLHVCKQNGGVYIKAGQFAGAFGAVPREYRFILSQLEDKAKPRPFKAIKKVLESELGSDRAETLFIEFDEQATAAASLAQVHRARLVNGVEVAVKLQYPGLRSAVKADLGIMKRLTALAGIFFPEFRLGWVYDELEAKLAEEMDFRTEYTNAAKLRILLEGHKRASVPAMYSDLCTPRMIIMEWIQGIKITDKSELQKHRINPRVVGLELVKLFAELTLIHGYVHGDPHPGNLMVRPKGRRSFLSWLFRGTQQPFEIVVLDHGTYLSLPPDLREQFCQLWCSFASCNVDVQKDVSVAIGGADAGRVLPLLLTHQAKDRAEERALQRSVGINKFSDMALMLSTAPRDLVEMLRINTVIRASSTLLGVNMQDRKRIFAWFARRGLPNMSNRGAHVHPSSRSVMYRVKLLLLLTAWSSWCMLSATVTRSWFVILGLFGPVLFEDV